MASGMMEKLQLKAGQRLTLVNPPQNMQQSLSDQMAEIKVSDALSVQPDGVLSFVRTKEEVLALAPAVFQSVKSGGLVWIAYPKGGSGIATDLNRDSLWAALDSSGWRPVRNVAIDEIWSALRFRPSELVGK